MSIHHCLPPSFSTQKAADSAKQLMVNLDTIQEELEGTQKEL
jgi:hypothetical protein